MGMVHRYTTICSSILIPAHSFCRLLPWGWNIPGPCTSLSWKIFSVANAHETHDLKGSYVNRSGAFDIARPLQFANTATSVSGCDAHASAENVALSVRLGCTSRNSFSKIWT